MADCKVSSSDTDGEDQAEEVGRGGELEDNQARMDSNDAGICFLSAILFVSEFFSLQIIYCLGIHWKQKQQLKHDLNLFRLC